MHAAITADVKAKKLSGMHDHAEHLTETANLLPGLSKTLAADKLARVEGSVKNLVRALDLLHDAADAGNQAETEKQLKTVDTVIALIAAQYPAAPMPKMDSMPKTEAKK
jgi:hypothetical protein